MDKKYLSKIIATDNEGLQVISACCSGAEVKVNEIKYLQKNKVFLLSLKRSKVETEEQDKKITSICKFEFVDKDGWPHYKIKEELPPLKAGEQSVLMKEAIVNYFEGLGFFK